MVIAKKKRKMSRQSRHDAAYTVMVSEKATANTQPLWTVKVSNSKELAGIIDGAILA